VEAAGALARHSGVGHDGAVVCVLWLNIKVGKFSSHTVPFKSSTRLPFLEVKSDSMALRVKIYAEKRLVNPIPKGAIVTRTDEEKRAGLRRERFCCLSLTHTSDIPGGKPNPEYAPRNLGGRGTTARLSSKIRSATFTATWTDALKIWL
jgi:hypothetical protein